MASRRIILIEVSRDIGIPANHSSFFFQFSLIRIVNGNRWRFLFGFVARQDYLTNFEPSQSSRQNSEENQAPLTATASQLTEILLNPKVLIAIGVVTNTIYTIFQSE